MIGQIAVVHQMSDLAAVTWLGHATCRIELGGIVFLTDPVLGRWVGPLARSGALPDASSYSDVAVVLISHPHHDHLDVASLRRLPTDTTVLAPPGTAKVIRTAGQHNVVELDVGETATFGATRITAVAAKHPGSRWHSDIHTTALGYLLEGEQSIYFAGDTGLFDGLADLRGEVDLALLPIGGWGVTLGPEHMDAEQAAEACGLIAPRLALPVHFGTLAIPGTRRGLKPLWRRQDPELFRAQTALDSPATESLIAPPGTRFELKAQG